MCFLLCKKHQTPSDVRSMLKKRKKKKETYSSGISGGLSSVESRQ